MNWTWSDADISRLTAWLESKGLSPGPGRKPALKMIGEGHSNITTLADFGETRLIIRHQPVIRENAPDVLREARHVARLNGLDILAPRVLGMAGAGEALDVPLYVMEYIAGVVVSGDLPAALSPDPPGMGFAMIDALAAIHMADAGQVTSRPLDNPEANRQHFIMMRGLIGDLPGPEGEALRAMADRLGRNIPDAIRQCVVHSDFRLGNLMWTGTLPPRLATVLDWELSTIGDPRLDLGYFHDLLSGRGITRTPLQDLGRALYQAEFPAMPVLLARYGRMTASAPADLEWFAAFVAWKTAVFYVLSRQRGEDRYYDDDAHCRSFLAAGAEFLARAGR